MDNIFTNEEQIRILAQIQENLQCLPEHATDSEISDFIKQIPPQYLTEKENLMFVCQLFGHYSRNFIQTSKQNAIKLFEHIIVNLQTYLPNESEFFWNIIGGTYYLHLWMHQKGLISIDEIIQRAKLNKYKTFTEYFLPEIIEEEPELFEREIKYQLNFQYTQESIEKFKELRKKHFKWLIESNDYNDPLYREIETNQLRLALKTDDIESFQKIYSNLNLTVNSKVQESLLENFFLEPIEFSLLEFSIFFNSIKIFKFLIMNGADVKDSIYASIWRRNYEIIHIIESADKFEFMDKSLYYAITLCNDEVTEYSLNNFDCYPFEKTEFNKTDHEDIMALIGNTIRSSNFKFLKNNLISFLRKNEKFVTENISNILSKTTEDYSGFFLKEFLKYPNININLNSNSTNKISILECAICRRNSKAVELLLNVPNIDLDSNGYNGLRPHVLSCLFYNSTKMLDLICNKAKTEINCNELLSLALAIANPYAVMYFFKNCQNEKVLFETSAILRSLMNNNLYTLKKFMDGYMNQNKDKSTDEIIKDFKDGLNDIGKYNDDEFIKFEKIVNELKI